jgi:hypothetical protein
VVAREQSELLAQPQCAAMAGQGSHLRLAAQALLTQEAAAVERRHSIPFGLGGAGGGGNGFNNNISTNGTNGAVNTGGGAGAGSVTIGGSGIVIIRYLTP